MPNNESSSYTKAIMNIKKWIQQDKLVLLAFLFSIIAGSSSILKEQFGSFNINYIFAGLIILSLPYNLIKKRKLDQTNNIAIPLSFYSGIVFLIITHLLFWNPAIDLFIFSITIFAVSLVIPVLYWITKKKYILYSILFITSVLSVFNYQILNYKEIIIAKKFLYEIKTEDFERGNFSSISTIKRPAGVGDIELFYRYKIWMEQNSINNFNIILGSVSSYEGGRHNNISSFDLLLKKNGVPMTFWIEDSKIISVFFKKNFHNFNPDVNKDGKADQLDIDLVISEKRKKT